MGHYTRMLGEISGLDRASSIVAALAPPASKPGAPAKVAGPSTMDRVKEWAPGVIGAVGGAYYFKKHRVLGAIGGLTVAGNILPLMQGHERSKSVGQLMVHGAGIYGSLRNHSKHPVLGYIGGGLVGAVVSAFVPGTTANQMWHDWRK